MAENFSRESIASGAVPAVLPLLPIAALYYAFLLLFAAGVTTGAFSLFAPVENGMAFNSMLAHLLRGEFDVDPGAIGLEGFAREGKTYAYFGVFVALLRLPLSLFGDLGTTDVTVLSCLAAAIILVACQLAAVFMLWRVLPPSGLRRLLAGTFVVATLLSGPGLVFLRPSIYQEVVLWANAVAAAFVCCAAYGLFVRGRFGPGLLAGMAVLAGLCLNTRVSTAVGLYAATGLLVARSAWLGAKEGQTRRRTLVGLLIPVAVLAVFAAACGVVNYERWGNPLTFVDLRLNLIYQHKFPERLLIVAQHGEFNPARIGYALLYYFLPIWAIRAPDGGFLFESFQHRFIDQIELPPASLLLSDPLMIGLAALGIGLAWHRRRRAGIDVPAIGAIAAGLTLPILLILMAIGMSYRYRGEFYPLLQFLACAGFFLACAAAGPRLAAPPAWIKGMALAGCIVGVLGSHLSLALYALSPLGPVQALVRDGSIVDFYAGKLDLFTGAPAKEPSGR